MDNRRERSAEHVEVLDVFTTEDDEFKHFIRSRDNIRAVAGNSVFSTEALY